MISLRFVFTVTFVALMAVSAVELVKSTSNFLDNHIQQIDSVDTAR